MLIQSLEKLIVNGRELSDREVGEMDAEIEKSRHAQRFGREERKRGLDAYEKAEHVKDQVRGRSAGPDSPWRQVMERYDFVYYPARELDRLLGKQVTIPPELRGIPDMASLRAQDVQNQHLWFKQEHPDAQWRNDLHRPIPKFLRLAFTENDLLGLFEGPESFARWIEDHLLQIRLNRLGLVRAR